MQASKLSAEALERKVEVGQGNSSSKRVAIGQKCPKAQSPAGWGLPSGEQNLPGGHGVHWSTVLRPVRGVYVPLGQGIGKGSCIIRVHAVTYI